MVFFMKNNKLKEILKNKTNLNNNQIDSSIYIILNAVNGYFRQEVLKGNIHDILCLLNEVKTISRNNIHIIELKRRIFPELTDRLNITRADSQKTVNIVLPYLLKIISLKVKQDNQNSFE